MHACYSSNCITSYSIEVCHTTMFSVAMINHATGFDLTSQSVNVLFAYPSRSLELVTATYNCSVTSVNTKRLETKAVRLHSQVCQQQQEVRLLLGYQKLEAAHSNMNTKLQSTEC